MASNEPNPPADLGAAGKKLWRLIVRDAAEQDVLLDGRERVWLAECAKLADRIALMEAALDGAELIVNGYSGQPVSNPLIGEIRLSSALLSLTLARIRVDLPESSGALTVSPTTGNRHRAAALSRWHGHGGA